MQANAARSQGAAGAGYAAEQEARGMAGRQQTRPARKKGWD